MKTHTTLSGFAALLLGSIVMLWQTPVLAAEFCSDQYYIDETLPNQARWDMCWEHRNREGIVLHKIHYTPHGGERRMVLNEAAVAQIHVPYDDNGTRYHDVTDYGLGNRYMVGLNAAECPGGKLLRFGNKRVICQQQENRNDAYSYNDDRLQGDALSLFSVSKIGAYNYIPTWRFLDDGSIEPAVGATGALQRYGDLSKESHGWLVSANKIGIAHLHNFFWKLDFDLAGSSRNDYVEEINLNQSGGRTIREMTRYEQETASDVNPQTLRRWRVVDGGVTNNTGQPISYEIRLHQSNHRDSGPDTEPFTKHDLYVTRYKRCEVFASHNPTTDNCADNLAGFVNGEDVVQEDIIIWPSTTFYHMPRAEDAPHMDAHWSSISITPRDWHDKQPLAVNPGTTNTTDMAEDDTDNSITNTADVTEDTEVTENETDTTGTIEASETTVTTAGSNYQTLSNYRGNIRGGGSLSVEVLLFAGLIFLMRVQMIAVLTGVVFYCKRLFAVLSLAALSGCAAESSSTQWQKSQIGENNLYQAHLSCATLPATGLFQECTISFTDVNGATINPETLLIDGGMPLHGHGLPTAPVLTPLVATGAYRIDGLKYNMPGAWLLGFKIKAGQGEDKVVFDFVI